jgi:hypothetical protein
MIFCSFVQLAPIGASKRLAEAPPGVAVSRSCSEQKDTLSKSRSVFQVGSEKTIRHPCQGDLFHLVKPHYFREKAMDWFDLPLHCALSVNKLFDELPGSLVVSCKQKRRIEA